MDYTSLAKKTKTLIKNFGTVTDVARAGVSVGQVYALIMESKEELGVNLDQMDKTMLMVDGEFLIETGDVLTELGLVVRAVKTVKPNSVVVIYQELETTKCV